MSRDELPDLERLSLAEKDDLIRALWPLHVVVGHLRAEVEELQAKVRELEGKRSQDSHNSSKPPSSDGLAKPPAKPHSLRKSGQHPNGGQPGPTGQTLKQVDKPDRVVVHGPPAHCPACHCPLGEAAVVETRQVFDLPPLRFEVTEHQVLAATCACGQVCLVNFPKAFLRRCSTGRRLWRL